MGIPVILQFGDFVFLLTVSDIGKQAGYIQSLEDLCRQGIRIHTVGAILPDCLFWSVHLSLCHLVCEDFDALIDWTGDIAVGSRRLSQPGDRTLIPSPPPPPHCVSAID